MPLARIVPTDLKQPNQKTIEYLYGLGYLTVDTEGNTVLSPNIYKLNTAICSKCRSFLWSTHRHDFVQCRCPEGQWIFIDGGNDYCRRGGNNPDQFINAK